MLLYYITDRTQFPGTEAQRQLRLLEKVAEAARAGVDYIQLREKDLLIRALESLARQAAQTIARNASPNHPTRLLINSRVDVALSVGADGVHLRSNDISPNQVRQIWAQCGQAMCGTGAPARELPPKLPLISVSCHSVTETAQAAENAADFAILAPIFEKRESPSQPPIGLEARSEAYHQEIPILALGGITLENANSCLDAGAAGIAAIRLFQENEIVEVVRALRS